MWRTVPRSGSVGSAAREHRTGLSRPLASVGRRASGGATSTTRRRHSHDRPHDRPPHLGRAAPTTRALDPGARRRLRRHGRPSPGARDPADERPRPARPRRRVRRRPRAGLVGARARARARRPAHPHRARRGR
ncbi:hypothetical protein C5E16_01090 [Clavibacter michiganensis]|uniref:Uncharacterized protein n=1 Tax=Clavibacter michiganensis TaxID=28447 RepID=A0A2S5VY88_9MICO|nr:hypothetical protein C5E16_01090 [Clavibacter michiganensis]